MNAPVFSAIAGGVVPTGRDEATNAAQHRPDPKAEPIPDGEHKYVPRSPYRTGNY